MEKNRKGTCVASRLWGSLHQEAERGGRGGGSYSGHREFRPMEGRREGRREKARTEGRQAGLTGARKLLEVQPAALSPCALCSDPVLAVPGSGILGAGAPPPPPCSLALPAQCPHQASGLFRVRKQPGGETAYPAPCSH